MIKQFFIVMKRKEEYSRRLFRLFTLSNDTSMENNNQEWCVTESLSIVSSDDDETKD